jgi:gamma-glutamyltranspeptidase / glutathione hydrolase / leukotriene-C4 hydrolase
MKKWTPNIMKSNEMERLSVVDDDYDMENPSLGQSTCRPGKTFRKLWIFYPKSACTFLALLAILPFAISLYILSKQNDSSALSSQTTDCDSSDAWAEPFTIQTYGNGVVAADDSRCSQIGAEILTEGGYAMDAAVAVALCLGVVSPASSGLGGGCFILGYNSSAKKTVFVDARETAPSGATRDMFTSDTTASVNGGLAIAIPGELKGLYLAWQSQGGGVSWERIVTPSSLLAERWIISPTVARYLLKIQHTATSDPTRYATLLNLYFHQGSLTPKVSGEAVENPALAATLRGIATQGPAFLYGPSATAPETLAREIQAAGGIITAEELRAYEPVLREAIEMEVFGYRYYGSPPPSSGGVIVGAILQFLSDFEEPIASQEGPSSPLSLHELSPHLSSPSPLPSRPVLPPPG